MRTAKKSAYSTLDAIQHGVDTHFESMRDELGAAGLYDFYNETFTELLPVDSEHCAEFEEIVFQIAQNAINDNPQLASAFNPLLEKVAIAIMRDDPNYIIYNNTESN